MLTGIVILIKQMLLNVQRYVSLLKLFRATEN